MFSRIRDHLVLNHSGARYLVLNLDFQVRGEATCSSTSQRIVDVTLEFAHAPRGLHVAGVRSKLDTEPLTVSAMNFAQYRLRIPLDHSCDSSSSASRAMCPANVELLAQSAHLRQQRRHCSGGELGGTSSQRYQVLHLC